MKLLGTLLASLWFTGPLVVLTVTTLWKHYRRKRP